MTTRNALDPFGNVEPPQMEQDAEQRRLTALKERLAAIASSSPQRLASQAIGMAALGYGYVLLVVSAIGLSVAWLVTLDGVVAWLAVTGAWFLGVFGVAVVAALWARVEHPAGRRVTRAGSPGLFASLDDIQPILDAPAPDVVLIDGDFNASVTEIPRFGIFGRTKRYLVVGLPLLEALPSDECRAILAHELAHLSRRDGRRMVWLARLSVTWANLAASLEAGQHWGRALFLPFFRWYAPRFELYAGAAARIDEYESDALAARCTDAAVTARALLRLHVYQQFVSESFLPTIFRESAERSEPSSGVFARMTAALGVEHSRQDIEKWSRAVLDERSLDGDAHPSLADRISALGVAVGSGEPAVHAAVQRLLAARGRSGADELLGTSRSAELRSEVEGDWQVLIRETWQRWHADALIWRDAGRTPMSEWSAEVLWARARWAIDCDTPDVAQPYVREVLLRFPKHLEATTYLGRLLAQSDDGEHRAEGIRLLEEVVRRDTSVALIACDVLEAHYGRRGWHDELARVQTRARQLKDAVLRGLGERQSLRASDRISPYPLPAATLATLQKACAAQKDVTRAYLIRKHTRYLREQPSVMLAVECDVPWYKPDTGSHAVDACMALLKRTTLPEAADLFGVPLEPRSRLRRRLRGMSSLEIYRRA